MERIIIAPCALALLIEFLTRNTCQETMGHLIGIDTPAGPKVLGAVFAKQDEYMERSMTGAVALPRGAAIESMLASGQRLIGMAHSHPSMRAFHSTTDEEYFSGWPIGSVSIVIGHDIQCYLRTEIGSKQCPFEICWEPHDRIVSRRKLDWLIPAVAVLRPSLDSIFTSVLHEQEIAKIGRIKAHDARDSWILYVSLLGTILLRISRPRMDTFINFATWIEDLLGYSPYGRIILSQGDIPFPDDWPIQVVQEFSIIDAKMMKR